MTRQIVNNNDALSDILSSPVGETVESLIGDVLGAVNTRAGFLSYFNPGNREVRFLGVKGGDTRLGSDAHDERVWSTLREMYLRRTVVRGPRAEDPHRLIFELIFDLAGRLRLTLPQLQGASKRLLISKGLSLGSHAVTPEGPRPVEHWSFGEAGRNMLRVQDSWDWAACGHDLERLKLERADTASYEALSGERPTILKVPRSADRAGLVTADTIDVFAAEHVIALDEQTFSRPGVLLAAPEPGLTFFFLPVRGLGQWRASVNWICVAPSAAEKQLEKQLAEQASRLSHAVLEELNTAYIIGIFARAARKALPPHVIRHSQKRVALRDAFTILFCAREVLYFKRGACVEHLVRDERSGELVRAGAAARSTEILCPGGWTTPLGSRYPGFFSDDGRRHPDLTTIRLSIAPVMATAIPKDEAAARLSDYLPFDEVYYRLHLFQGNASEIRRWGDQLAECLGQIVNEQYLRQVAFERERERVFARVYEHVAHFLGGSLEAAGLDATRKTLRRELRPMLADSVPLKMVNNALTLLTLTEGSVGLLRLIGILSRKEYGKLGEWFDDSSLGMWCPDDPRGGGQTLDRYVRSIVHLARAIGSARGRPWVAVEVNGRPAPCDDSYCEFDRRELHFPPLSLSARGEAVYAMLPALVEPLVNALRFYADAGEQIPAREPIRLKIDDRRQSPPPGTGPHISVGIGNLCPPSLFADEEALQQDPPGVQMTRRLMTLSRLATLMPTEHDGAYRWVTVHLHPQRLHAWIHTHERPAARRTL